MAGELRHATVGGELTQAEWESIDTHTLNGVVRGDMIYYNGTHLVRRAIGAAGTVLVSDGVDPVWSGSPSFSGDINLASGSDINWATGDVRIAHSPNVLAFIGASSGYTFDAAVGITGALTATSLVGPLTGNASTATALQTARTINGVSFNGTANITVTAAAGTLSGATLAAGVTSSSLTSVGTLGSLTVTGAVGAGSFVGPLTGNVTGNASTATILATARTINGVSFDGSANITVTAAAGTLTGATLAANVLASSLTSVGTLGALTVTGAVNAGSFVGPLTGNASTATVLQTARLINGVSFDGSADITIASAPAAAAAETLTGTVIAANVIGSSLTYVGTLVSLTVSTGTNNDTTLTVGTGGAAPSAVRQATLRLDAPHSGSWTGGAIVVHARDGTDIWTVGIDSANTSGAKGSNTDYFWVGGAAYRMALSTAGVLTVGNGVIVEDGGVEVQQDGLRVSAGNVGIGSAPNVGQALRIVPIDLAGTSQFGIVNSPIFTSSATTSGYTNYSQLKIAESFTMTAGYTVYVETPNLGAGSAITTIRGVHVANQGATGVTNAYGVYIAVQSGALTTNIGLYNAGTTTLVGAVNTSSTATIGSTLTVTAGGISIGTNAGTSVSGQILTNAAAANTKGIFIQDAGVTVGGYVVSNGNTYLDYKGLLTFRDTDGGYATRLTLSASGALGVPGTVTVGALTVAAGGLVTLNRNGANIIMSPVTGTNGAHIAFQNTGNPTGVYFGIDNSAGTGFAAGGSAYATTIWSVAANPIQFATNNIVRVKIPATGGMVSTSASGIAFQALSGNAGNYTYYSIGRTTDEGQLAVSAGASSFLAPTVAGDIALVAVTGNLYAGTVAAEVFGIVTNNILRMTVDSAGAVALITGPLSIGTTPATAGTIRLPNASSIQARNNANDANWEILEITTAQVILGNSPASGRNTLIRCPSNGSITLARVGESGVIINLGVVVGTATGGDKGVGTLNAVAVYDDNVILTDFVFEPGYKMLSIQAMRAFYEQNFHLPTIPGRAEWEAGGSFPLGKIATHLWETIEVHAKYITELDSRLTAVEKILAARS